MIKSFFLGLSFMVAVGIVFFALVYVLGKVSMYFIKDKSTHFDDIIMQGMGIFWGGLLIIMSIVLAVALGSLALTNCN